MKFFTETTSCSASVIWYQCYLLSWGLLPTVRVVQEQVVLSLLSSAWW